MASGSSSWDDSPAQKLQQPRSSFRSVLFKTAVNYAVKSLNEAAARAEERRTSQSIEPPTLPPRANATHSNTECYSDSTMPRSLYGSSTGHSMTLVGSEGSIASSMTLVASQPDERVALPVSRSVPTFAPRPRLSTFVGNIGSWKTEVLPQLELTIKFPQLAQACPGVHSRTQFSYYIPTPDRKENELSMCVFPLFSQATADEYVERMSRTYLKRDYLRVDFVSRENNPRFYSALSVSTTHTAILCTGSQTFQDNSRDVVVAVILRPNNVDSMGIEVQVQGRNGVDARYVAMEMACSVVLQNTGKCQESDFIGKYIRSSSTVVPGSYLWGGGYMGGSTYESDTKLWLFGDGIYILDFRSKSVSGGVYLPSTPGTRSSRETGSWYVERGGSQYAGGKLVLLKTDGTEQRPGSLRRGSGPPSLREVKTFYSTESLEWERKPGIMEYWDVVSMRETRHGYGN